MLRLRAFTLCALIVCFVPCAALGAQSTSYDFNGARIDAARLFRYGEIARITTSAGFLKFAGTGARQDLGLASISSFEGDFDITLDFRSFAASSSAGEPALNLYAFDAIADLDQGGEIRVGLRARGSGFEWIAEAERKGNNIGFRTLATTARSGQLRIFRSNGMVGASVRPSRTGSWTQVLLLANYFSTSRIKFVIESEAGIRDAAVVECDWLRVQAQERAGSPGYGARCFDLGAAALNAATLGNPAYALLSVGNSSLAAAPFALSIGAQQLAVDLTPAGAPGCALNASLDFVFVAGVLDAEAQGAVALPIPQDPRLNGVVFFAQMLAATTGNAMGIAWSNGVRTRIAP